MWVAGDGLMFGLMMVVFLMWSMDDRAAASGRGWLEAARRASLARLVASHPAPASAARPSRPRHRPERRRPGNRGGIRGRDRPSGRQTGTSAAGSMMTSTSPPITRSWPG